MYSFILVNGLVHIVLFHVIRPLKPFLTTSLMIIRLIIIITTQKNITKAIKIDLLNHISNRDTIKICMFKCRGKIFTRELIFTTYHKKNLIMFM